MVEDYAFAKSSSLIDQNIGDIRNSMNGTACPKLNYDQPLGMNN
jgi:hypothetical protein